MFNKKGVELTFNTIIIAVLVIAVLIIMIAIYTGHIGKSSTQVGKIGDEAGSQVNEISWCMATTLRGKSCEKQTTDTSCAIATKDANNQLVCPTDKTIKKIDKTKTGDDRYICCP